MSYFPNAGPNASIFWAYNSSSQQNVQIGDYFEVDVVNEVEADTVSQGGVRCDVASLVYGEMQTSGQSGYLDKAQTRFFGGATAKASGEGFQVATNKADSYDIDDGNYQVTSNSSLNLYLQLRSKGTNAIGSSGVDQTRIFGIRLNH